jgi:hypothetical protein
VDSEGNPVYVNPKPYIDEEDDEDPANYLGFGIVSYFSLIKTMILIFMVLSLVHLPVMKAYSSYKNYSNDLLDKFKKDYSIGNLGFATPKCVHMGLGARSTILSCSTGKIKNLTDFGYLSINDNQDACMNKYADSHCAYDRQALHRALENQCLGQKSCTLDNPSHYLIHNSSNYDICSHRDAQFFI